MLKITLLAMLLCGTGAGPLPAEPGEQVAALRERLSQLEGENVLLERALAEKSAEAQQRAEAELALLEPPAPAASREPLDARSSFFSGPTAGWDGHPFLASAEGDFLLEIEARLQMRYVLNHQDAPAGEDGTRGGFEMRRIRTILSGHIFDPSITYKLQATFSRNGGSLILEDALVQKRLDCGAYVQIGQFRPPLTRESVVSTFRTTAVERSLAHGAIEISRTQGIEIGWEGESAAVRGMFHDGDGNANSPALDADTEFAVSGRGELLLAGKWKQFNDFTAYPGDEFALLLGAGAHYEKGEYGAGQANRSDDFRWTADASFEFNGAHLFAAIGGRNLDPDHAAELDVLIAMIEGGLFVAEDIEAFLRYEWGDDGSASDLSLVTIGATKFWQKHSLKWTNDVGYAFEPLSDTFASSGAGWREDAPDADGQIVFRSQFQLSF